MKIEPVQTKVIFYVDATTAKNILNSNFYDSKKARNFIKYKYSIKNSKINAENTISMQSQ